MRDAKRRDNFIVYTTYVDARVRYVFKEHISTYSAFYKFIEEYISSIDKELKVMVIFIDLIMKSFYSTHWNFKR